MTILQLDSKQRADSPLACLMDVSDILRGKPIVQLSSSRSIVARKGRLHGQTGRLPDLRSTTCTPHQRGDCTNHGKSKSRGSVHISCEGIAACGASGHVPRHYFHAGQYTPEDRGRYLTGANYIECGCYIYSSCYDLATITSEVYEKEDLFRNRNSRITQRNVCKGRWREALGGEAEAKDQFQLYYGSLASRCEDRSEDRKGDAHQEASKSLGQKRRSKAGYGSL